MFQVIQDKSVQILETVVERLESIEQLQKRPRVFAKPALGADEVASSNSSHGEELVSGTEKLK